LILLFKFDQVTSTIKYVFDMFLHGSRSPKNQVVKGVDSINQLWTADSEITSRGIRNNFLIGSENRLHYINKLGFLNSSFTTDEIELFSVNTNRSIMSIYAYLNGFYPPYTGPILLGKQVVLSIPNLAASDQNRTLRDMGWAALPHFSQTFPIYIFSKNEHYFDLQDPDFCTAVGPIQYQNTKKQKVIQFMKNFDAKYGSVKKILNYPANYFYDFNSLTLFCDAILCAFQDKRNIDYLKLNLSSLERDCQLFVNITVYDVHLASDGDQILRIAMTPVMKKKCLIIFTLL